MLRRYLITNGVSTVALYGAIWALVPSPGAMTDAVSQAFSGYLAEHTLLSPMFDRIIMVGAGLFGLN